MVKMAAKFKRDETHPDVVIDIDPIIVDILSEPGFVTEIANLLPLIHRATRFEHGQRGAAHDDDTTNYTTTTQHHRPPHTERKIKYFRSYFVFPYYFELAIV